MQGHGLGNVTANVAVFGARDLRGSESERLLYGSMLQSCVRFGANVAVVNVRDDAWRRFEATPPGERTIALWWSDDQVGQLITLLGWLCRRHPDWSRAGVTAFVPDDGQPGEPDRVRELLQDARIDADVVEVERTPAAFTAALSGATLALAPLRVRRGTAIGPFETPLGMLLESLPLAAMLLATEELDLDAEPDDGELIELARATEQAREAAAWAAELDRDAAQQLVAAEVLRLRRDEDGLDDIERAAIDAQLAEVESAAAEAYRTYVDARVRCTTLEKKVEELSAKRPDTPTDPDIWRSASATDEA